MASPNRPSTQDRYRKIVAAIPKYLSTLVEIILAGVTYTPATLVQFFQQQIALLDGATNARASLHQFAQDIKANHVKNGPILKSFNDSVRAMFVNQPQVLAEFGLTARKVPVKTTTNKALAAQRNVATRVARHTMGKKQRLSVKGTVPAPSASPAPVVVNDAPATSTEPTTPTTNMPATLVPPTTPITPTTPVISTTLAKPVVPSGNNGPAAPPTP